MRGVRQFCAAAVLTLTITLSASAGEISFPGEAVAGEISTPGVTADPVMEIALEFLLNVSSLL
jgi:hypothetical protein